MRLTFFKHLCIYCFFTVPMAITQPFTDSTVPELQTQSVTTTNQTVNTTETTPIITTQNITDSSTITNSLSPEVSITVTANEQGSTSISHNETPTTSEPLLTPDIPTVATSPPVTEALTPVNTPNNSITPEPPIPEGPTVR